MCLDVCLKRERESGYAREEENRLKGSFVKKY